MRTTQKPPVAGFTELEIRARCRELECDPRTYRKELAEPGKVWGVVGNVIRRDIEAQRALKQSAPRRRSSI